jgi:hypothetical protein
MIEIQLENLKLSLGVLKYAALGYIDINGGSSTSTFTAMMLGDKVLFIM